MDFVVARYGEFVLLKPAFSARNALLWATPLLLLAVGGGFMLLRVRQGKRPRAALPLTPEEEARLAELDRRRR